jgi:hypothetical protein
MKLGTIKSETLSINLSNGNKDLTLPRIKPIPEFKTSGKIKSLAVTPSFLFSPEIVRKFRCRKKTNNVRNNANVLLQLKSI